MEVSTSNRGERRAEWLLIVMAAGIVGITGVVSALALIGEWWFLAATMATLLACAVGVVLMILRLLAETGDPVRGGRTAEALDASGAGDSGRTRGRRTATPTPALGGI